MLGMKLEQAKEGFFTSAKVLTATDKATRKVLSKFGAFVRRRARSSIRKRKKVSEPGQPPSSHLGLYKDFIFFGFDPKTKSVVIGPVRLNRGDGSAPRALELGGNFVRMHRKQTKTAHYRPRPAIRPAFEAELPGAPGMWANAIK